MVVNQNAMTMSPVSGLDFEVDSTVLQSLEQNPLRLITQHGGCDPGASRVDLEHPLKRMYYLLLSLPSKS